MTQEEKTLLLKELSARLPYNLVVRQNIRDCELTGLNPNRNYCCLNGDMSLFPIIGRYYNIIPYLRPMSSMTMKELDEWGRFVKPMEVPTTKDGDTLQAVVPYNYLGDASDWLNAHHFDFRNLISRGLALEAPNGMYCDHGGQK